MMKKTESGNKRDILDTVLVKDHNVSRALFNPQFQNYKIYKHNKLIESKSDFSVMEHRIIVLALAQIKKQDVNLKMYRIYIQDVLGKKPHTSNYNLVRNAVKRLHKSTIDMEEVDGWKSYSFITKAQGKYGVNFIEIQFHEDIQRFLLGLKSHYTSYTLGNVMKFKKNYSLRIYELCKQYAKIGNRTMDLHFLRNLLSLENKHIDFRNFKKNVLIPAVDEINQFSDIQVSFSEIREGKRVKSVYFFVHRKQGVFNQGAKTLVQIDVEIENNTRLDQLGFNDDERWEMRKLYNEEKISCSLDLFEKNIDAIKFPKPWLEKALKENYMDSSAYKKQLVHKEDCLEKLGKKLNEIREKKREMRHLQESIYLSEEDIAYYKVHDALRPGDVMRFPENYTTEDTIEEMEDRILKANDGIADIEKELEILKNEADALN